MSLLALPAITQGSVIPYIRWSLRPDGGLTRYVILDKGACSIRDLRTQQEIARVPRLPMSNFPPGPLSPDGALLALRAEGGTEIWDIARGTNLVTLPPLLGPISFFHNNGLVSLGTISGQPVPSVLCDLRTTPPTVRKVETVPPGWTLYALSPDGTHVLAIPNGGAPGMALVDTVTLAVVRDYPAEQAGSIMYMIWSADSRSFFTGSLTGTAARWQLDAAQPQWSLPAHEGRLFSIALTEGGRGMATQGNDGLLKFWDFATLSPRGSLPWPGPDGAAIPLGTVAKGAALAFDPHSRRLLSGGSGGFRAWSIPAGGAAVNSLHRLSQLVVGVSGNPGLGGLSKSVVKQSAPAELKAASLGLDRAAAVSALAWSPRGRLIAWAGTARDKKRGAWIVDAATARDTTAFLPGEAITQLRFTADETACLAATRRELLCYDAATGTVRWRISHHRTVRNPICFAAAANSPRLAAALAPDSVSLLDAATGAVLLTLTHPVTRTVRALDLSPHGNRLCVLAGTLAQVWHLDAVDTEISGHKSKQLPVVPSPDKSQ